jgi:hypothetical protein
VTSTGTTPGTIRNQPPESPLGTSRPPYKGAGVPGPGSPVTRSSAPVTAAAMTERDLQTLVLDAACLGGWLRYHTFDSRRSAPGFPDLILARGTELLAVELKSSTGRVGPEQRDWLEALDRCGIETAVIRPRDADELVARLVSRTPQVIPAESR